MTNQPAGLDAGRDGATTQASEATDQHLIGPGAYALGEVYCFGISSLPPAQRNDLGLAGIGALLRS